MASRSANWSAINSFVKEDCTFINMREFNPYDYAVSLWSKNNIGRARSVTDLLRDTRNHAIEIAGEYAVPLETNAKLYARKCELAKDVDDFMTKTKPKIDENPLRNAMSSSELKTKWLKTIKIEREIEIFDKIEFLMMAPNIVHSKIEQGKIFDAAQQIIKALSIYNDEKFDEISSLVDVKRRLDECRQFMVNHVMKNLFSELFVEKAPKEIAFYKSSPDQCIWLPDIPIKEIQDYTMLLITLKIQDDFISNFTKRIRDCLAQVMSQTASDLKVKKARQYLQTKDKFEELVDIANSYNLQHPLVCFLDRLLSKLWVLLVRCNALDEIMVTQHVDNKTLDCAFTAIDSLMIEITTTFIKTHDSKEKVNDSEIKFQFLSSDTTPTNGTASSLRSKLGIKPCSANTLQIFPMMDDFFECAEKKFNVKREVQSLRSSIDYSVISIFRAQANAISTNIDVTRPVKTEYHSCPVLISTPTLIENMEKFISIAAKFPYLQNEIISFTVKFLNNFNQRCSEEICKGGSSNEVIWSIKLLNEKSLAQYLAQEITTQLVIDQSYEKLDSKIKDLADVEEANEEQLMSGNVYLNVENTVRLKYHIPQVAAIAESFDVLSRELRTLMETYMLSSQSEAQIEKLLESFKITIIKATVFLRIEMRCRTYADIVQSLMTGTYSKGVASNTPDQYVSDFASTFRATQEALRPCLLPSRFTFVFIGIPRLVYDIHIRFAPRLGEIDDKGAGKLTNNLAALNQVFANAQYPEIHIYKKALALVSNISYSAERLLRQIVLMKDLFTYEEMEPVFNMQQRMNERHAENLEKLRQILKK